MCKNAVKTAATLMAAIEPTLKSLLTVTGLLNTPNGQAAITAYDAALAALENWQSGTPAAEVIQLIGDFQTIISTLPIPAIYVTFANIILAGIATVIGVVTANSPAPAAPAGLPEHPEAKAMFQAHTAADTASKVQALVPGFQRSIFHSPESQYNKVWNQAVDAQPTLGLAKV
jgi:hypothetical protein